MSTKLKNYTTTKFKALMKKVIICKVIIIYIYILAEHSTHKSKNNIDAKEALKRNTKQEQDNNEKKIKDMIIYK